MTFDRELLHQAQAVLHQLEARGLTITTAESCTGGLLGALLTELAGSSKMFTHGYITYSNTAKTEMIVATTGRPTLWNADANPAVGSMSV